MKLESSTAVWGGGASLLASDAVYGRAVDDMFLPSGSDVWGGEGINGNET